MGTAASGRDHLVASWRSDDGTVAALAALYTLIVQVFVQRDLRSFSDLRRVMSHSIALWAASS
jgi:hypothetical protein